MAWDPAHKNANLSLSNSNLTVTNGANATSGFNVRTVPSHTTGRYYFECKWATALSDLAGIATAAFDITLDQTLGKDTGLSSIGYYPGDGTVRMGGVTVTTIQTGVDGDTVCVAADLNARLIWFRTNGGNWNNNAANNPTTGVGGISLSTLTAGAVFAALGYGNTGETSTSAFGATAFAQAVPVGFVAWDAADFVEGRRRIPARWSPRRGPLTGRAYVEVSSPPVITANAALVQDNATLDAQATTTPFEQRRRRIRKGPARGPLSGFTYAEVQSPIYANANLTQADATLSASATVAIAANASLTQANATLSATATVAIAANAALTQADASLSASATAAIAANAVLTQDNAALTADATTGGTLPTINANAALTQDNAILFATAITGIPDTSSIGGKRQKGSGRRRKKRDLEVELQQIEEAIEAPASPFVMAGETVEADLVYTNAVTLRLERLIADIDAALERARTAKAQADLDNLMVTALVLREKLEEEEQMIAMLLLHL